MKLASSSSGLLLHPTSLHGPEGIGTIGRPAREFVDRLAEANQRWWQILPLNPPGHAGSPYASDSAFAGNPLLVDLRNLCDEGLLTDSEWRDYEDRLPDRQTPRYDISRTHRLRRELLETAFDRWYDREHRPDDFRVFCDANDDWLDDYALYSALSSRFDGASWRDWPDRFVERRPSALEEAKRDLARTVEYVRFAQWLFERQWSELREYAAKRDVRIFGDAPIFVAMESADVWANRSYFQVDASGRAEVVAGVPPDYFSETGQKWGNPLYDWETVADDDFDWWMRRLKRLVETVDLVRIDHFRGFEAYWAVPSDAPTAETGEWRDGPGDRFFEVARERLGELPFVAEDLGTIDDAVRDLRDRHGLPGMKVMQFAFDGSDDHPFLPHTYPSRCVAYTGTHDNDTTRGWFRDADEPTRHQVRSYLSASDDEVVRAMIESILASDASLAMFPVQDILELGSSARMNTPGTTDGNWNWRLVEDQLDHPGWDHLARHTRATGRASDHADQQGGAS